MKKTCATCKHCVWDKRGGRKVMTCKEYSTNSITVLCDPPYDEACPKYEGKNMKITIEVPDTAKVVTYQCVYDDETDLYMKIIQRTLDTNALNQMQEENNNAQNA